MEEATTMELQLIVNPGTAVSNFEDFKAAVAKELEEKYMHMEVSDESLKEARAARARLNAAKDSLKAAMRSAQLQNDEPLEIPKKQAKELEQLLSQAINTLDVQIKEIEAGRREQRMITAKGIMAEIIASFPEAVQEIAVQCNWLVKDTWGNANTSAAQIKRDVTQACQDIQTALMTFNGDFRPQMLDDFIEYGNVSKALLFGQKLQRQKDAYEEAQRRKREEEEAARAAASIPAPEPQPEPEPEVVEEEQIEEPAEPMEEFGVITLEEPRAIEKDDMLQAFINIKIVARRYQIKWVLEAMKRANIPYIRLK